MSDLNILDIIQQILMHQLLHTNLDVSAKPAVSSPSTQMIMSSSLSANASTLPDSMDPSKALSETDITDKVVQDLANVPPIPSLVTNESSVESRTAALKYLFGCYSRVSTEEIMYPKVCNL